MIACKPTFPPYLNALLPQDQIFDPEDLDYEHKAPEEQQPQPKKRTKSERKNSDASNTPKEETPPAEPSVKTEENVNPNWDIDNPYLAATKLPLKGESA